MEAGRSIFVPTCDYRTSRATARDASCRVHTCDQQRRCDCVTGLFLFLYDFLRAYSKHLCFELKINTTATRTGEKCKARATDRQHCFKHYGLREAEGPRISTSSLLFSAYNCRQKYARLLSRPSIRTTARKDYFFLEAQKVSSG